MNQEHTQNMNDFSNPLLTCIFHKEVKLHDWIANEFHYKAGERYSDVNYGLLSDAFDMNKLKPEDITIESVEVNYGKNRVQFLAVEEFGEYVTVLDDDLLSCAMLINGLPENDGDLNTLNVGEITELEDEDQAFLDVVNAKFGSSFKSDNFPNLHASHN